MQVQRAQTGTRRTSHLDQLEWNCTAQSRKGEYKFSRRTVLIFKKDQALKLIADFFVSPIEAAGSEIISSVFWKKITFSIEFYACCNMEAIFQKLRRRGEKDIFRKTKMDIFATKRLSLREISKDLLPAEENDPRCKEKRWIEHFLCASSNSLGHIFDSSHSGISKT